MNNNNLNQDLYSRFGLILEMNEVQEGCKKYLKGIIIDTLGPITKPGHYQNPEKLWEAHENVLEEVCRQLFLDSDDYYTTDYTSGLEKFINEELSDEFEKEFNEYTFRLQVLINIANKHIPYEVNQLALKLDKYFSDFPILGVTVKIYKRKSPQILPITSKKFEQDIKNTLGLLETDKKYEHTLSNFENGLKEFLTAKTQAHYKDVIEDMYTSCDELVKAVLKNKNKGFKHISDKSDSVALGLNGHQKELYKNLRNWMDEIKHGTLKNFDRNDTEMIITMTGSLIRFVILEYDQKP